MNLFAKALGEEGETAKKIKDDNDIIVIVGNPPYKGSSMNNGKYIKDLIKPYFPDDEIKEKNPKWLQDDYVKFIRFAEDKISKAGKGVVGIITNHSFLDNPTFRAMRKHLMDTFDKIYILDLHGNAKKKEKSLTGKSDKNVFDIEQGVAITFFVKNNKKKEIYHTDVFGDTKKEKFTQISETSLKQINKITPNKPFYLFIPQNQDSLKEYNEGISLRDIFVEKNVGITTGKDAKVIAFNNIELNTKITTNFGNYREQFLQKTQYRPFDNRVLYYNNIDKGFLARDRKDIVKHFINKNNIGLIYMRGFLGSENFNQVFVTDKITDISFYGYNSNVAPLYRYSEEYNNKNKVIEIIRTPNFTKDFSKMLQEKYGEVLPEEVMGYIYAVLYCPSYRSKYLDFLKIDFPRITFTENKEDFLKLARLGQELINAHLLKEIPKTDIGSCFDDKNNFKDTVVDNLVYSEKDKTLYFNKFCYFKAVNKEVWNFTIGRNEIINKYLKYRKGRELITEEITHLTSVIKVLDFTVKQMQKIDEVYKTLN